jgi:hypothetical protein
MRKTLIRPLVASVIGLGSGCGTTVVFVPQGTPVQLAEPVRAHVFVVQKDGTRVRSANKVEIPAGWWAADITDEPQKAAPNLKN